MNKNLSAVIYALSAVLFYGVNVPFSKILLENINPVFMAALLYLGAGLGIGIIYAFHDKEANNKLARKDLPYVIGMILLDSIAPIFLMAGIKLGTSSGAALIGNFEIVATALFALLLGFVSYGLSIFTYIRAQKTIGAAKTSAYYVSRHFTSNL